MSCFYSEKLPFDAFILLDAAGALDWSASALVFLGTGLLFLSSLSSGLAFFGVDASVFSSGRRSTLGFLDFSFGKDIVGQTASKRLAISLIRGFWRGSMVVFGSLLDSSDKDFDVDGVGSGAGATIGTFSVILSGVDGTGEITGSILGGDFGGSSSLED